MRTWSRLADRILSRPRMLLAAVVLGTAALATFLPGLQADHGASHFFPENSPTALDFEQAGRLFGFSRTILFVVSPTDDPYDPAYLDRLRTVTERLEALPGVDHALSLASVPQFVRRGNRLAPRPLLEPNLERGEIRARIRSQPFQQRSLVSPDERATLLIVKIDESFNDTPEQVELVDTIQEATRAALGTVHLAGLPYLKMRYTRLVKTETPLFTLLALALSMALLYAALRSTRAVVLPTLVVGAGLVWILGLMSLLQVKINVVTSVLPGLMVVIGMANSIHIATKYYTLYAGSWERRRALKRTIETVGFATFLTCFTTAIGFAVLIFTGSRQLSDFGLFSAVGIMLLYALSITIIPVAFLLTAPVSQRTLRMAEHPALGRFFEGLVRFVDRRAGAVFGLTAVVLAIGLLGVGRVETNLHLLSDFDEDDPIRESLGVFEESFGGMLPMHVVVQARKNGQFRSLANLRRLDRLQQELAALPDVRRVHSAADMARMATQAYFGGDPRAYRLPSALELPFLQRSLSDLSGGLSADPALARLPRLVDSTFTTVRLSAGVPDIGSESIDTLRDSVLARAGRIFPPDAFRTYVTGTSIVFAESGKNLVRNLLFSLSIALLVISALMALLFRSFRLTVISLIPNIVPLLLVGGAMGHTGIVLKPSTALIFSISFGIAVDDTIHFLARYRMARWEGHTVEQAVATTLRETGKAILFTSIVLVGGFSVFIFSGFGGTSNLGLLTALTLALALATNLLLLPALLITWGPRAAAQPASDPPTSA